MNRHKMAPMMSLTTRTSRLRSLCLGVLCVGLAAAPAAATSPWELLEDLRRQMVEAGPVTGRFEQVYIPAGFSSGDTETGHLSLWLPKCLRWNYEEPEAKHFLLCDDEVWFWNDLEEGGRHYRILPEEEPGLDLLLVEVDRLKERYVAESERLGDGTFHIRLATPEEAPQPFRAVLHVDPVADRVIGLEYTDGEGNQTRFTISNYQNLAHSGLFQPPQGVEWIDE